jgi:hypothetical protein
VLSQSFRARYPSVNIDYVRSSRDNRQVQLLLAYKRRRYGADVITSFSNVYDDLRKANALVDLREFPAFRKAIPEAYDPDGLWAAERITYWRSRGCNNRSRGSRTTNQVDAITLMTEFPSHCRRLECRLWFYQWANV